MDIPEFEDVFYRINKNLKFLGISFNSSLGLQFYLPVLALFFMIVEESSFFVSKISSENFLELTALAPCIGIGVLSMLKISAIAMKRQNVYELVTCLRELYENNSQDANKRQIVREEIVLVKSLTKYYFILNWILISVYNFSTLVLMSYDFITKGQVIYSLPYSVIVPFSTNVWYNWIVVYTHSIFCGFWCVLFYTTVDALYCNLTSQVCSNFAVISDQIEKLTPSNVDSLVQIVKQHQHILSLSDVLEEIFTAPNLFNVLVGSIEICALGFNLMAGDWSKIPGVILFLSSEILQILVMSVFGENLIRESNRVGEAAFLCEWYNMAPKYKKIILIIMTRSHKPQKLTAYKFSVISYGSFTKIMSTSWSYFTILKTIYKPSEVSYEE